MEERDTCIVILCAKFLTQCKYLQEIYGFVYQFYIPDAKNIPPCTLSHAGQWMGEEDAVKK